MRKYYGHENTADIRPVMDEYPGIESPDDLYDALSELWCEYTCAPRLRHEYGPDNKTLGQCSVTAFLAQDIFGGTVYGILRSGGNYHCFNVVGSKEFDLTSEQFMDEVLDYTKRTQQIRETHFAKEEKKQRYEYLKNALKEYVTNNRK